VITDIPEARSGLDSLGGLAARLAAVPLFAGMDGATLDAIAAEVEWFSLPGGVLLYAEGEPADGLFVVLSGLLGILGGPPSRDAENLIDVRVGESIGEVGLFTGRPHTSTVIALRDSTLARIPKPVFDRLVGRFPPVLLRLATEIAEWAFRPADRCRAPAGRRTLAFLAASAEPVADLARAVQQAMARTGRRTVLLDASAQGRIEEDYDTIELAHDVTLYCGDGTASNWSLLCLRRADLVLFIADGTASPRPPALARWLVAQPWRRVGLILMQDAERRLPPPAASWLDAIPVQFHRHIRRGSGADLARLVRDLTDRGVGLVLSGGGARAYGHLGVIAALREYGIPFDFLGGTSMGAIIAGGLAREWSLDEVKARMFEAFVRSDPLGDLTFPILALTRGHKVSTRLQYHFGSSRIEDLWRPYFTVSSNLTTGKLKIHDEGVLWRALRASIAIPGLLPPVIVADEVLVDGAVMNNMPAEPMAAMSRGPVIGVDVGRREIFRPVERGWLSRHLLGEDAAAPGIAALLLRAGTIASEAETQSSRQNVDLLIEPPLNNMGMRDWKSFDRAIDAGYRHTIELLGRTDLTGFRG
jgi:NTE family protein